MSSSCVWFGEILLVTVFYYFSCSGSQLYDRLNHAEIPDELKRSTAPPFQSTCTNDSLNKTVIFVSIGVVVSLCLVLLIIISMRRFYQPMRPKIKKTYVVHKNVTPLTCRPTTEQCEITIEDCCNMNICDTVSGGRRIVETIFI